MKRLGPRISKHLVGLPVDDAQESWTHRFLPEAPSKQDVLRGLRHQHRVCLHNRLCCLKNFTVNLSETTSISSSVFVNRNRAHKLQPEWRSHLPLCWVPRKFIPSNAIQSELQEEWTVLQKCCLEYWNNQQHQRQQSRESVFKKLCTRECSPRVARIIWRPYSLPDRASDVDFRADLECFQ